MDQIEIMKHAAKKAGAFILGSTERESTEKSNSKDFVTVSDIKSQNILRQELQAAYPGTIVLSEEDDETARQALFSRDFSGFVLDPIDGTYNFKRDMRESAISIGYVENGEPVAGVIYDPYKDELFEAVKGQGARLNGALLRMRQDVALKDASVCTSNSYDGEAMRRNLTRHLAIYDTTGTMPWTACPGSGVLIMAWLTIGRFDAYHHNGLKPWDNAAAFLVVREAGGKVVTLDGRDASFTTANMIIGVPGVVDRLVEVFAGNPDWQR